MQKKLQPIPKLTAEELKAQAIAFKQEGKLKEAANAYRKYKAVQEEEKKAAAAQAAEEERQRKIAVLRSFQSQVKKETESAEAQLIEYNFMSQLATGSEGQFAQTQLELWQKYLRNCSSFLSSCASKLETLPEVLSRENSELRAVEPGNGLQVDPASFEDDEIVLTILCAKDLHLNQELAKKPELPQDSPIRVEYSTGSLVGEKDPIEGTSSVSKTRLPSATSLENDWSCFDQAEIAPFEFRCRVNLKVERSKRTARRLIRRKVDLRMFQVQTEQRKKSGGLNRFFGGGPKEESVEVAKKFIGRVSVELKGLVDNAALGMFLYL